MILVPRQLQRVGITGDVPYYGGRFTASQAYAAAHPYTGGAGPRSTPRFAPRPGSQAASAPPPPPPAPPAAVAPAVSPSEALASLQHLLDTGVITSTEYDQLRARVSQ
jgi:hypothetical protein